MRSNQPSGLAKLYTVGTVLGSFVDPDPDPHQSDKMDLEPDPRQFADERLKCMEYEPILARFRGFTP